MEIFSAAISLLGLFLFLIICVPIILVIGLFLYARGDSRRTSQVLSEMFKFGQKIFLPQQQIPGQNLKKRSAPRRRVQKASNMKTTSTKAEKVEDAEFREVK